MTYPPQQQEIDMPEPETHPEEDNQTEFEATAKCPLLISFDHIAYTKLRAYIRNVKNEVGGLGKIEVDPASNLIVVKDVFLLEQEVSPASTTLNKDGVAKFYTELAKKKEDPSQYKLWWHSHCNFGVFWSGTDESTIEKFDQETQENNWFLSVVGNHVGDMLCRLDVFWPFRYTYNNVPYFRNDIDPKIDKQVKKEIENKVTEQTYPANSYYWNRNKKKDNEPVIIRNAREIVEDIADKHFGINERGIGQN